MQDNCIIEFGSMFIANDQGTEKIRNSIYLARSTPSHLHSCLRSRCEILLSKVEQGLPVSGAIDSALRLRKMADVCVADERMPAVFENSIIRDILRVRRKDCVPTVEIPRRLRLNVAAHPKKVPFVWSRYEVP